jgi:hypothetical protein
MRFNGFRSYGTFWAKVGNAKEELKFQLIKLQHDMV